MQNTDVHHVSIGKYGGQRDHNAYGASIEVVVILLRAFGP
jgi:hypothetical protein